MGLSLLPLYPDRRCRRRSLQLDPTSNSVRVHRLSLTRRSVPDRAVEPRRLYGPWVSCAQESDHTILVPLLLQDPTALPGLAVRHRKYLETLESLDYYGRNLLLTSHPCAGKGLYSPNTFSLDSTSRGVLYLSVWTCSITKTPSRCPRWIADRGPVHFYTAFIGVTWPIASI